MLSSRHVDSGVNAQLQRDGGPAVDVAVRPATDRAGWRSQFPAAPLSESPAQSRSESLSVDVAYRDPTPRVELVGSPTARTAPLVAVALESPIRAGYRLIEVSVVRVTSMTFAGAEPPLRVHESLRRAADVAVDSASTSAFPACSAQR